MLPPCSLQKHVHSYLHSLKSNPYHILDDQNQPSLHKLTLPDGSIAFSIHKTPKQLLHILSNDPQTGPTYYLEDIKTPELNKSIPHQISHDMKINHNDENTTDVVNNNTWRKIPSKNKTKKKQSK